MLQEYNNHADGTFCQKLTLMDVDALIIILFRTFVSLCTLGTTGPTMLWRMYHVNQKSTFQSVSYHLTTSSQQIRNQ